MISILKNSIQEGTPFEEFLDGELENLFDEFDDFGNTDLDTVEISSDMLEQTQKENQSKILLDKIDMIALDGAVIVHLLCPKNSSKPIQTFDDYYSNCFLPFLNKELKNTER